MASILIIDDEPEIRDTLVRLLKLSGHAVRSARDGVSGLMEQRNRPAELVITDIMMPRVNGVALIEQLRSEFPAVRIVAMSGGGNFGPTDYAPEAITTNAYLAAADRAGADLVLTKPFDRATLLNAVKSLCEPTSH